MKLIALIKKFFLSLCTCDKYYAVPNPECKSCVEQPYEYLGDFSATPPWHSRQMQCDKCRVSWTGCWDNFMCPKCGKGELPNSDLLRDRYYD